MMPSPPAKRQKRQLPSLSPTPPLPPVTPARENQAHEEVAQENRDELMRELADSKQSAATLQSEVAFVSCPRSLTDRPNAERLTATLGAGEWAAEIRRKQEAGAQERKGQGRPAGLRSREIEE